MASKKHIFLSYSRKDSKFALHLAKDLKKSNFNIWVDQFNIPGGEHWDDNIEKALDNSCAMIVILSPSSVASDRVKDEVSYALENNIHILPIRYKDTQIPYRWRRLQSMDIDEKNYDKKIDGFIQSIANFATCGVKKESIIPKKDKTIWAKVLILLVLTTILAFFYIDTKKTDVDDNNSIEKHIPLKSIIPTTEIEDTNISIAPLPPEPSHPIEVKQSVKIEPIPIENSVQKNEISHTLDEPVVKIESQQKVVEQKPKETISQTEQEVEIIDPYENIYRRYLDELKKDNSTKLIIISHTNAKNEYDKAQEKAYDVSLKLRSKGLKRSNIITKIETDGFDKITFDFRKMVK